MQSKSDRKSLLAARRSHFASLQAIFGNPDETFPWKESRLAGTSFLLDLRFARQLAFESGL